MFRCIEHNKITLIPWLEYLFDCFPHLTLNYTFVFSLFQPCLLFIYLTFKHFLKFRVDYVVIDGNDLPPL
jgi:hypothetical protein